MTIRDEYEAGATLHALAKKHGKGLNTIRRAILKAGGSMRSPNPPIRIYPEVIALHQQGKPRRAILKAVGCSDYAYAESLRSAGIVPDFRKKERTTTI